MMDNVDKSVAMKKAADQCLSKILETKVVF